MSILFKVTRRDFLRDLGVGTGALVFGCSLGPELFASDKLRQLITTGIPLQGFISIKPLSGHITIFAHRSEMGQGIKSSLAAVLADELEADWGRVTVRQADADSVNFGVPAPYPIPGAPAVVRGEDAQFTDSSRSMAAYYMPMRLFGAAVRLVMTRAAAMKWSVPESELEARDQQIWHQRTGRSIQYHHLLLEANKVKVPETDEIKAVLKKPEQFRYIGKENIPFVDAKDMVTGKAVYGADVDRPGMLIAMIVRCPVANGTLKSFDATAALAVPGVRFVEAVIPDGFAAGTGGVGANFVPHAGVAVIADNTWAAWQGRRALLKNVQWDLGPNATYDSDDYRAELEASTSRPGKMVRRRGNVDEALGGAAKVVEAGYHIPHLAQAPMEPPAAIAVYEGGKWEIWSPTQGPELAQHYIGLAMLEPNPVKWLVWGATEPSELRDCERDTQKVFNESLARLLGVDQTALFKMRDDLKKLVRDKITVHVTLLGGGFGRKSNPDYAMEAAFLARNHPGVPIRVQWTREDDIKFSFYNAVSRQYFKAGLDASGHPTSLLHRSAFSSFFATLFPPAPDIFAKARAAFHNGGEYLYGSAIERAQGLEDNPYGTIDNLRVENSPAPNHIRCGWMRSVANIYHAFGLCSFADEMAVAAGRDSKDYLLELIGQGHMYTEADLKREDVPCYDNNLFPINRKMESIGGKEKEIMPGYPPDTRRLRAVAERVARESGWDAKKGKLPKGRGLGIAAHRSFLSYVAMVIDVSLNDKNELTINEIHAALDCGRVINPDRARAQMEGGIIYGLSLALLGEITVKNGAVVQNNFDDYPVLRMHQTPKIFTYFQEPSAEVVRTYPGEEVAVTGTGEPPTPAVAPALANAIVAAGGPRIREIPFYRKVVVL
ncbi:MAG TPA: molybdopterin cofactor-binding domain-containing protein [Thermoanaerobaculia bacterium]|jgi:isoquinoline 1-oxidoreductase beta subunit|nr:molybdopterin cofactor-binding domain-containing protein [Thermoanaerobaculia bacterium]